MAPSKHALLGPSSSAMAAAETIRVSDCIDDKVAAVTAFTRQTLELLAEDEDDA